MTMYTGELDVEPDHFSLKIEQLAFRKGHIAFDCHGRVRSTLAMWNYSMTAERYPEGHYKGYHSDCSDGTKVETEVYILRAKQSLDGCFVEGFWYERTEGHDPEVWRFSGSLEPF